MEEASRAPRKEPLHVAFPLGSVVRVKATGRTASVVSHDRSGDAIVAQTPEGPVRFLVDQIDAVAVGKGNPDGYGPKTTCSMCLSECPAMRGYFFDFENSGGALVAICRGCQERVHDAMRRSLLPDDDARFGGCVDCMRRLEALKQAHHDRLSALEFNLPRALTSEPVPVPACPHCRATFASQSEREAHRCAWAHTARCPSGPAALVGPEKALGWFARVRWIMNGNFEAHPREPPGNRPISVVAASMSLLCALPFSFYWAVPTICRHSYDLMAAFR